MPLKNLGKESNRLCRRSNNGKIKVQDESHVAVVNSHGLWTNNNRRSDYESLQTVVCSIVERIWMDHSRNVKYVILNR